MLACMLATTAVYVMESCEVYVDVDRMSRHCWICVDHVVLSVDHIANIVIGWYHGCVVGVLVGGVGIGVVGIGC